ncbi:isocitrate lyase/phosphoenolpyruvate mutase family protein [Actinosynnema sp. NPDC020468]|uniref:isocitrate lyase/PEP mutase family protein n=1 Tax=Actinosynnema sp. NPDC020468 TaxID=3154488 RepID=UPI0033C429A3
MAAAVSAAALRALHVPGDPLVLPNVWDAASARVVADAGFPAVATASHAVCEALGYAGGVGASADEVFDVVARVARAVDVPVTADVERGYGLPGAVLAERLAAAGAVGCNLEDSDPATGGLVGSWEQVALLRAVREADPELVINARVDVFLRGGEGGYDDAVARARAYLAAGADCVFPILLPVDLVARFVADVGGPVNVLHRPGDPTPAAVARWGVARVSLGPNLHRASMAHLAEVVAGVRAGGGLARR